MPNKSGDSLVAKYLNNINGFSHFYKHTVADLF